MKSSTGDFGQHSYLGTFTNNKKGKSGFDVYCKNLFQKEDYFIKKINRDSEYQNSGAVRAKIVEASNNFTYLIGAECSYAVTYL